MTGRKWVSAIEAGLYFSKPPKTMYSLAARGLLPAGSVIKLGWELRFNCELIEAGAKIELRKRP